MFKPLVPLLWKTSLLHQVLRRHLADMKFIDIGANLTDPMFQGEYHGSKKHEPDLDAVLARAFEVGLESIIVTGGSVSDSEAAIAMANTDDRLFATVGCHPTRCGEFESCPGGPDDYAKALTDLVRNNKAKVVAFGEFGLDYERLQFCPKETQKKYLDVQLDLASGCDLPLFLHCRQSADDLVAALARKRDDLKGGVVHSFDGSVDEANRIIEHGFLIGLNGCSLKTEANLAVVKAIPAEQLLLETDAPWCEVRPTHAGFKHIKTNWEAKYPSVKKEKWKKGATIKGRNEPSQIINVLEVVAGVKEMDPQELCEIVYSNTKKLFFK